MLREKKIEFITDKLDFPNPNSYDTAVNTIPDNENTTSSNCFSFVEAQKRAIRYTSEKRLFQSEKTLCVKAKYGYLVSKTWIPSSRFYNKVKEAISQILKKTGT